MMALLAVPAALLGACLGSFASTAGLRMAESKGWVSGRSACDGCSRTLSYWDTAPVIGYVLARGRCAACSSSIPFVHLVGEITGFVLAPLLLLTMGPLVGSLLLLLAMTLFAASLVDLRTQRLPDPLTAVVASLCTGLVLLEGVTALGFGLASAAVVLILGLTLRCAGKRLRGEAGLGLGDIKLAVALALLLCADAAWMIVGAAAAALAAIFLFRPATSRIAFGPYIAAAGFALCVARELA